jgi:hypothetical protein
VKRAEYPAKSCRDPLFGASGIGYACELPALHTGPCANFSAADTVAKRDQWEAENPDHAGQIALGGDIIVDSKGEVIP